MSELSTEINKNFNRVAPMLVGGLSTLSGLITVALFELLIKIRETHIHSAFNEDEYEEIIYSLKNLVF